ncbi:DUF1772 domain-containing protein [Plantactinospora sp. BC1]|uniref:anthrone oxygenase family protein n=1 Tax=Plantactinospora sp. BC1 TaxID=2108470 RepID=UPI001F36F296|nr:DUF1772 domain-containing protein [Plantactinospora sp. BC1]
MLTGAVLGAAAMTTGLVAGVFVLYAHTIMPGLGRTDDRTFVGAFQAIDRSIINPWFMSCFFGSLVLTGVAAALHLPAPRHDGLPWTVAAFVLNLVVIVITLAVNVPRNDAIKAAGEPDRIADLAGVRRAFDEPRWRAWNLVRVVLSCTAFGSLLVALVSSGQRG